MNDIDILKLYFKGGELDKALEKYRSGIPAAYIIGEWEFCGDRYIVNENCLIPRCDTERTVEKILDNLKDGQRIADLCTGSGCIIISVLKRKPNSMGIAVEISEKAAALAITNAEINGVSNRLKVISADLFTLPLENEKFDIISSNPPYIQKKDLEALDEYVKKEPLLALDGGENGTVFYEFIVSRYGVNLTENGMFIFEIGYDQEDAIKLIAKNNGYSCTVTKDYSGNPRVALLKKLPPSEEL